MANGKAAQVTDDEWDYQPAKKQDDDEWDYRPAQSAPDLRTGKGMEAAASKQAAKQVRAPLDNLQEKQTAFSMFTPTGITRSPSDPELERVRHAANVSSDVVGAMSMVPGAAGTIAERGLIGGAKVIGKGIGRAALGGAAGGAAGGYAGREIGGAFGHAEAGREVGAGVGGLAGGFLGAAHPEVLPSEGRFGKLFNRLRPEVAEFPGAPLPSTEEFYAKRGAELNSMRKLQPGAFKSEPWDVPTQDGSVGAPLPSAGEFYEQRGKDLTARGRQQEILDRKAAREAKANAPKPEPFAGASSTAPDSVGAPIGLPAPREQAPFPMVQSASSEAESVGAKIYPEPRDPLPGDRPGAMWSVGRKEVLPAAAQRGTPGAVDVMRNTGQPILLTPREGVGYSQPGEFQSAQKRMQQPESVGTSMPSAAEPLGLKPGLHKPSEKVQTMSEKPRDLGPEFTAQQWQEEINRNKGVLRNPWATAEEKAIARDRLRDAEEGAAGPRQ